MHIQLALHSSPRFSTWLWFNDWKILVDAGDGASQHLGYKLRKIDTVLLTHSHRDHIGGLLQVINQRGEAGPFTLAHPANGRSYRELENFSLKFNPGSSRSAVWQALEEGDWVDCGGDGRLARAFRTRHYHDDNPEHAPRSLGFHLMWRKNKVKPEYANLGQKELDAVRRQLGEERMSAVDTSQMSIDEAKHLEIQLGREAITSPVDEKIVSVSGDCQPFDAAELAGTQLLVHEATFLSGDDYDAEEAGEDVGHMHSTVADALGVAQSANVRDVVLYHISTRYSDAEIRDGVRNEAARLGFEGRIWATLPRRVYWDILGEKPVWDVSPQ